MYNVLPLKPKLSLDLRVNKIINIFVFARLIRIFARISKFNSKNNLQTKK